MAQDRSTHVEVASKLVADAGFELPDLTATSSIGALIRHRLAASVIQLLENEPGVRLGEDPEAVHRYRVAARRLRSDLRTFRSELDSTATDDLRGELSWLGSAIGPLRDLDVLGTRIADHARALPDEDQPGAAAASARLADERTLARAHVDEVLRGERYAALIESLIEWTTSPRRSAASDQADPLARERVGPLVKRRWKQLRATVEAGGDDPSDEALHRIRIAAKRCRYAAEAAAEVVGAPAHRFAAGLAGIQDLLGDLHDTVVSEAWLRNAAVDAPDARVAIGGLIAIERAERARLRSDWDATWKRASRKKARRWFTRGSN